MTHPSSSELWMVKQYAIQVDIVRQIQPILVKAISFGDIMNQRRIFKKYRQEVKDQMLLKGKAHVFHTELSE